MNRKGDGADIIRNNLAYMLFFLAVFVAMLFFVSSRMDNVAFWEDFYAKEIARVIDFSKQGDEVKIDVTMAVQLARKNKVEFDKIFIFDNEEGSVAVSLSRGTGKSFRYFNNVSIENEGTELSEEDVEVRQLIFNIK